jgi:hypothetical protein
VQQLSLQAHQIRSQVEIMSISYDHCCGPWHKQILLSRGSILLAEQSFWLLTIGQGTSHCDTHSQNIISLQCITSPQSIPKHCAIMSKGITSATEGGCSASLLITQSTSRHHNGRTINALESVLVHSWIHATLLLWCLHTLRCCCGCTRLRVGCCTICGILPASHNGQMERT